MRKKVKEKKIELKDIWILALTIIGPIIAFVPITVLGPLFVVIGVVLYTLYATIQAMNQKFNLLTILLLYGIAIIIFYWIAYNLDGCYKILGKTYNCPINYYFFPRFINEVYLKCFIVPPTTYIVGYIISKFKKDLTSITALIIIFIIGLLSFYGMMKVVDNTFEHHVHGSAKY